MLQFDRHARLAFIIACLTLAASGLGFRWVVHRLNVFLQKEPVELRDSLSNIPSHLGPWTKVGQDESLTEAVIETLGSEEFLSRGYARDVEDGGDLIVLHVVYYTGFVDAVPHIPDRCLEAGGWRKQTLPRNYDLPVDRSTWYADPEFVHSSGEPYPVTTARHPITGRDMLVRLPVGDFQLRVTEFHQSSRPDERLFAGYFFIANGRVTSMPMGVKRLAFDTSARYAYYAKVQFSMYGDRDFESEQFVQTVAGFSGELLPQLMRCLPDWAEVDPRPNMERTDGAT